ncbi:MAG: response regulator [Planctomycetota bacterium]|jgi:DNA-binding NtrC family response regulator
MRILVVEDEADVRELLKEGLESYTGFRVDTSPDRSAVDMARERQYDLVIADMHLSDDLDALTIIKEITEFDHAVRFIVMTGKKRLDVATKLVQALKGNQVSSFLFKPFDLEELCVAVDRVRDQMRTQATPSR